MLNGDRDVRCFARQPQPQSRPINSDIGLQIVTDEDKLKFIEILVTIESSITATQAMVLALWDNNKSDFVDAARDAIKQNRMTAGLITGIIEEIQNNGER